LLSAIEANQSTNGAEGINHLICQYAVYTAEVLEGETAYKKGLRGKYYVLYFEGWEHTDSKDIFTHRDMLKGMHKKLVLMKDGEITEHQFGRKMIGVQFYLDIIPEKEKAAMFDQYEEWKKSWK
jgi:hypothetical protein